MQIPRVGLNKRLNMTEAAGKLRGRVSEARARFQRGRLVGLAVASGPLTTQLVAAALDSPDRFQITGLQPVDRPRNISLPWDRRDPGDERRLSHCSMVL